MRFFSDLYILLHSDAVNNYQNNHEESVVWTNQVHSCFPKQKTSVP